MHNDLISVELARELVKDHSLLRGPVHLSLDEALESVLYNDVMCGINLPAFRQSAMDGYGLNMIEGKHVYAIVDEVRAGDTGEINLHQGEACRIFTGARVPDSVNCVVMQEKVMRVDDRITVEEDSLVIGKNIRKVGEQLAEGEVVAYTGQLITPGLVGLLASIGMDKVEVFSKPRIGLLVTGDELVVPGTRADVGKVFECNSYAVKAVLESKSFPCISGRVPDDYEATKEAISQALNANDVLILTGGVSVGDYDFVAQALEELGVNRVFHKVKQKPGKPIYFGTIDKKLIFGLPGNPGAALSCTYIYVLSALFKMTNTSEIREVELPLDADFSKKGDRAVFLQAIMKKGKASILPLQNSNALRSFAEATCIIYIPADRSEVKKGESVKVVLL